MRIPTTMTEHTHTTHTHTHTSLFAQWSKQPKQLLTQNATETDIRLIQKREGEALEVCYASNEHKEAITAFLEKRPPDFKMARSQD